MEVGIKPNASCCFCHASIGDAREILAETGLLTPDMDVRLIDGRSFSSIIELPPRGAGVPHRQERAAG